jgi:hypothetical protein
MAANAADRRPFWFNPWLSAGLSPEHLVTQVRS